MNRPPKIRSDYHALTQNQDIFLSYQHWIKPALWLLLGFIIGVLCYKAVFNKSQDNYAYVEMTPIVSLQANLATSSQQTGNS